MTPTFKAHLIAFFAILTAPIGVIIYHLQERKQK